MTVPEACSNERLRRYQPRSMRFPVGDRCLRIVVPAGREYLRRGEWARTFGRGDEPPYWVEVWPASMAAVWALARGQRGGCSLAGRRVLDLGCGQGLPGVAAASLGADVTFLDREADALAYAEWNARRQATGGAVVATVCGDWSRVELSGSFDVVVLADVTYRPSQQDGLLATLLRVLAPDGVVLHADPHRDDSSRFLARLQERLAVVTAARTVSLGKRRVDVRLALAGHPGRTLGDWCAALGLPVPVGSTTVREHA